MILVYGAGVIGTLYAARLQDGGNHVTVVARGQRLADIRRYGLELEDIVGHAPAFRHGSHGIARARPSALYQDDSRRYLRLRVHVVGKIAAAVGDTLRFGVLSPSQ